MKNTIEVLFKTKWLELRRMFIPEWDVTYDYVEAVYPHAVAILPYRLEGGQVEYLLRNEVVPPWGLKPNSCAITGSIDKARTPVRTAVVELKEETGYTVTDEMLEGLGSVRNSKASTTRIHLFTVDLTGLEQGIPTGDGSVLEEHSESYWTPDPLTSRDVLIHAMYAHLTDR